MPGRSLFVCLFVWALICPCKRKKEIGRQSEAFAGPKPAIFSAGAGVPSLQRPVDVQKSVCAVLIFPHSVLHLSKCQINKLPRDNGLRGWKRLPFFIWDTPPTDYAFFLLHRAPSEDRWQLWHVWMVLLMDTTYAVLIPSIFATFVAFSLRKQVKE